MSDKIEQLKELVSQLQAKIEKLESQASSQVKETVNDAKAKVAGATGLGLTPSEHLRVVLLGPPGSGAFVTLVVGWFPRFAFARRLPSTPEFLPRLPRAQRIGVKVVFVILPETVPLRAMPAFELSYAGQATSVHD